MQKSLLRGQGTIEYLVIIAVVVVVSLVVVGIMGGMFGDSTSQINIGSNVLGGKTASSTGGISIAESAVDDSGNGLIKLSNLTGEDMRLTGLSVVSTSGNVIDNNYDSVLVSASDSAAFLLADLSDACECVAGETRKTCTFIVNYVTASNLHKSQRITTNVDCVGVVVAKENPSNPLDQTSPAIVLLSPIDNPTLVDGAVDFTYSVTDNNAVSACSLTVDDVLVSTDSSAPFGTFSHTITGAGTISHTYSIACADYSDNTTSANDSFTTSLHSASFVESCWDDVTSPHTICNCDDLNTVRTHLDWNYVLSNDINMQISECAAYSTGAGFVPIGAPSAKFTGTLDGANYTINGLYVNSTTSGAWNGGKGLFASISGASLRNIHLANASITGLYNTGALVGYAGSSNILHASVSGNVNNSSSYAGGLVGYLDSSRIENSYSTATVFSSAGGMFSGTGGLIGYASGSSIVKNSFSTGNVTGYIDVTYYGLGYPWYVGGFVGNAAGTTSFTNSYATGDANGASYVGGFAGAMSGNASLANIYSTGKSIKAPSGSYAGGVIGYSTSVGGITNSYWYDQAGDSATAFCPNMVCGSNCILAPSIASFYPSSYAAYTVAPVWNDGNWSWSGSAYPTLN